MKKAVGRFWRNMMCLIMAGALSACGSKKDKVCKVSTEPTYPHLIQ